MINENNKIFNDSNYWVPEKEKTDPIMYLAYLMLAFIFFTFLLNFILYKEEVKMNQAEQALQTNP